PPAADAGDRKHDRQGLHRFDERTQKRCRDGRGYGCPREGHDGWPQRRCAATLASSNERGPDRSITFLSFSFRSGLAGSALRRRPASHEPEADREQRRAEEDTDEAE